MKNIEEILKEFGLEIPADKKTDFDKLWKENYRTKADYDKAVEQRDGFKTSLADVQGKLDQFKDVDVEELKSQISTLQADLKKKDDDYAAKEAERIFGDSVNEAIKAAGGKNAKAVRALLDIDTLKASKNQSEDIKKAIETVKNSDAYLFGSEEPFNNPVGSSGGNGGAGSVGADEMTSIRAAMGLPAKKAE